MEGAKHPDRDAQFAYLNAAATQFQAGGDPVIGVDTKKKELIGNYSAAGREWEPAGQPTKTNVHDFADPALGKVAPYGVYDITTNTGWVNVGTDADTAQFAVESIRRWWTTLGATTYPASTRLLITADSGGSNGSRLRLWKTELAALATQTGLDITVCHLPPGTSKWNKIEHRLFWQSPGTVECPLSWFGCRRVGRAWAGQALPALVCCPHRAVEAPGSRAAGGRRAATAQWPLTPEGRPGSSTAHPPRLVVMRRPRVGRVRSRSG